MLSVVQKSDNSLVLTYRVIGHVAVAMAVAATYCLATLPAWPPKFWAIVIEALLVSHGGLAVWTCCIAGIRYNIPLWQELGPWYHAAVITVCAAAVLMLGLADAAIFGYAGGYEGTMITKAFCLLAIYSATALGGILANVRKAEDNEAEDVTAEPALPTSAGDMEAPVAVDTIHSITVKTGPDINIVDVKDIIFLKAEGDYVSIVTERGCFLKEQTMKYFADALPKENFMRIHRSYIINSAYLRSIEKYKDYQMVLMAGGEKIRNSASGYKVLKEKLGL